MYHSDSAAQLIYQFELNETGEATNRRIFSSFGEGEGSPDGMTIDAAGDLWVAFWDGWCLRRFSPDGNCRETLRSEEHTSELQSLMRISYAVFCLKKKKVKSRTKYNTR